MDLPRDIFGIVKLFLTPLSKLALSHTCRKYRQMFGTLKSIINDHCYDAAFISRFMHHATSTFSPRNILCNIITKDNCTNVVTLKGEKHYFYNNVWTTYPPKKLTFTSQIYTIKDMIIYYENSMIMDLSTLFGCYMLMFSQHIFIIWWNRIIIMNKNGDNKIIKTSDNLDVDYYLSENMFIIDSIMFHKNGFMYKCEKNRNIIAVCDYIMWKKNDLLNVRYIP